MTTRINSIGATLTACTLLAACSGGGGTALSPARSAGGMLMRIRIPAAASTASAARRPQYVSVSTNGIGVSYRSSGSSPAPFPAASTPDASFDVSSTSTVCSSNGDGSRTCSLTVPAPSGTLDFQVTAWDQSPSGGGFSGAAELGQATVLAQTIAAGQQNTLAFVLNGIVNSIYLTVSPATLAAEAPNSAPETATLTVNVEDADGNIILANDGSGFSDASGNPMTITLSQAGVGGSTVQTTLSTTNVTPAGGPVTLTYTGGTTNGTIVSANPSTAIAGSNTPATLTIQ